MVMKKLSISIVFLFLMILSLGVISGVDSCSIKLRTFCNNPNDIVMGVSSSTNAHGELWNQINYDYVLCCNFGTGDRECSPHLHPVYKENASANKIIGLSSATNAHAETPGESNYKINVCYENLACISTEESCGTDYTMEVLSLSDYTNAHIGGFDDYNICCEQIECPEGVLLCSDYLNERECNYDPCDVGYDSVQENSNISCGEGYICNCLWENEKCSPYWEESIYCGNNKIDSELGETCDGTAMPFTECSGNIDECTGGTISCYSPGDVNECTLDLTGCTGCKEGGFCGDGIIQSPNNDSVYENCDNESLKDKTCEDFGLLDGNFGLACYPPEHANNCTFNTTGCVAESHPETGKCKWEESTSDNCDDEFLTYSFVANIEWTVGNEGWETNPDPSSDDYVQFNRLNEVNDDGKWHYDPNRKLYDECISDSTTVPCPAQIQLPFFGTYSIVVIVVLITLVYVILSWKKKKFDSKRKVKKK